MSEQEFDPNKGYIALLGWSLNAVEAADKFDRRYVVVAPDWAEAYCKEHDIPYVPWNFERLNDRSVEISIIFLKNQIFEISVFSKIHLKFLPPKKKSPGKNSLVII